MPNTVDHLSMKSESLIKGIEQLLTELKNTNGEIAIQIQMNEGLVEQARMDIEQLNKDNEALMALRAENEKFIAEVTKIILD